MKKIKRALISLSNKDNLEKLLPVLLKYKIKLICSGGTFKQIKKLKFKCIEVSKYTNSPEILNGRVKTLHPKIHAGILSKRNNKFHKRELIKKKKFKSTNFEIRFHLEPNIKIMKTYDGKSILIELENEGWKFTCYGHTIDVETGLYFGKKNSYTENQNIFISGMTQSENQTIKWELIKI